MISPMAGIALILLKTLLQYIVPGSDTVMSTRMVEVVTTVTTDTNSGGGDFSTKSAVNSWTVDDVLLLAHVEVAQGAIIYDSGSTTQLSA
tara:strand:+ start:211 stop:480 length:270 start_codon:yes stop_codon:yes gene_type:complete